MPIFDYVASDLNGRLQSGSQTGATIDAVMRDLQLRRLLPTRITLAAQADTSLDSRIRSEDLAAFFRMFATLHASEIRLTQALDICAEQARSPRLREAVAGVLADVNNGKPLGEAFAARPADFPNVYTAMIKAGEKGGILPDALRNLATMVERNLRAKKKVDGALAYPKVVLGFAGAMVLAALTFIVPMFRSMFATFGVSPKGIALIVFTVSDALTHWWYITWPIVVVVVFLSVLAWRRLSRSRQGKLLKEYVAKRVPLIGELMEKTSMARVTRMLGLLMQSQIQLAAAIESVIPVAGLQRIAEGLVETLDRIRVSGMKFSHALAATGKIDSLTCGMVSAGDATGAVDEMLLKVADYYDDDLERLLAQLNAYLEPALLVFLGLLVLTILFSVYGPLYQLMGDFNSGHLGG